MDSLEVRIKRNAIEDQLYIGELIEKATQGEFGQILKLIINGMVAEWLAYSEGDQKTPADRYLGRIEAVNKLQERLDYCIEIKNRLLEEHKESEKI